MILHFNLVKLIHFDFLHYAKVILNYFYIKYLNIHYEQ